MSLRILLIAVSFQLAVGVYCQGLPATGLFSFQISKTVEDSISLNDPRYLTSFNEGGYNNQPHISDEGIVYFSIRFVGENQNDIYALDLAAQSRYRITSTDESEYSPWLDASGKYIYCVQTDLREPPRQRLWKYPADRKDFGYAIWQTDEQVGYYAPIGDQQFAVFTVAEKNTLHFLDLSNGHSHPVVENIGRCLRTNEKGELYFIHEQTEQLHYLKVFAPGLEKSRILTRMPLDVQDFCLWDDKIWYGQDSQLKYFDPSSGTHHTLRDLSKYGIEKISRLDIRNGILVLVNEKRS